jgi:hypothetical protein
MQIDEITAMVGYAEDEIRDLSVAITADEEYRAGGPPNEYTRYLEGRFLETVGKWMAMLALLDFMRSADRNLLRQNEKGDHYDNH